MAVEELDRNLRQFYAEARNKEGENYSRATLLSLRNGIERYLNTPPHSLGIRFTHDPRFVLSNQMLDAKIKQLKQEGMQNTKHKPAIEKEDLAKLKTSEVFSLTKPLSLLRNVWFHVSLFWCRRGFEGQRNLKKTSFAFERDATGCPFVTMTHDETTMNHPGGISEVESFEKNGRMYKTTCTTDGYSALEVFLTKLNPQCDALFQYPKRNWRPSDKVWYENRPLGKNKLSSLMKEISVEAGLSRTYTNHSVRATAITLWANAGLTDREIMAISGHRNEASLRSYHNQPSVNQLRKCSDVLTVALCEDEEVQTSAVQQSTATRSPFQQLPCTSSTININSVSTGMAHHNTVATSTAYSNMFNSCKIGSVNITFHQ